MGQFSYTPPFGNGYHLSHPRVQRFTSYVSRNGIKIPLVLDQRLLMR